MKIIPGVDIVSIERVRKVFSEEKKLNRVFSPSEVKYILSHEDQAPVAAGRFAAKEAIYKCLSPIGISFDFRDISIITDRQKGPYIRPETDRLSKALDGYELNISISHERDNAIAFCVLYEK